MLVSADKILLQPNKVAQSFEPGRGKKIAVSSRPVRAESEALSEKEKPRKKTVS